MPRTPEKEMVHQYQVLFRHGWMHLKNTQSASLTF